MRKKFLTENDRLENLKKRGQAIKESFQKEYNKIKRLDEAELSDEELEALAKEDEEYENQATRANLKETMYNEEGQIEIKPKDDARCPDGRCQMYEVYYNGEGIYEFSSHSFKGVDPKQLAVQIFDTYNQSKYNMNYDTAIKIVGEMMKYVKR